MENYCVYIHEFPNGKTYIGMTSNAKRRWGRAGGGYRENETMMLAIRAAGWDNIRHIIIADGLSKIEAAELEVKMIEKYKSSDPSYGYNVSGGGLGVGKITEPMRKKLSESRCGPKNPQYGKPIPPEQRTKISESMLAKEIIRPKEERERIAASLSKRIVQREIDGGIISEWASATEAAKHTGINRQKISDCCNNKRKTTGGFKWSFA
jgi:group I intron endonuclease